MGNIINVISDSNYRSKFLDALYDLRTSLAIKRILSKTIPVSKFKEILVTVKSNYDDKIKDAIDSVFEEFLPVKKDENKTFNTNEYSDNKMGKDGASLVMAKKGFKSDPTNLNDNKQ